MDLKKINKNNKLSLYQRVYKCTYVKLFMTHRLGSWEAKDKRHWVNADDSETPDRMVRLITVSSKGTQRHAWNHSAVIEVQNTANTSRTWLQTALFPWAHAEILSQKVLHCNRGSVYTQDIYALITENQIQIGQSEHKFLHPKTPSFS